MFILAQKCFLPSSTFNQMGGLFEMATRNFFFTSVLSSYLLLMQAANIEAESSGIPYSDYQLIKHEVSCLGRGKYSGTRN